MMIRIVTDSTCDLPGYLAVEHAITVVPLYINFGSQSFLDGVDLSRQDFYAKLSEFDTPPTTSAPSLGTFVQTYERLAEEGASGIISIHIAASLSNIVNVAHVAAEAVQKVPVTVVDSGQLTLGMGLLAVAAAQAGAEGRSVEEIVAMLDERSVRTYTFAALDTLEFLRRSGRLSRFQSSLGMWLKIKPLLKMHYGAVGLERVRTRRKAFDRLISLATELGPLEQMALVHTCAPDQAEALQQQATHLFPDQGPPLIGEVTPVIGAHIGPGAVGFVCVTARPR